VGTTGHSLLNAIKSLKDAKIIVDSAFVIINRLEGARENLEVEKVKLYEITDILGISNILHSEGILDDQIIDRIKKQMGSSK
jgi:orotate phosphoribosyltransferase